jgi:hypothetical protein
MICHGDGRSLQEVCKELALAIGFDPASAERLLVRSVEYEAEVWDALASFY